MQDTRYEIRNTRYAFTLAELLIALAVTSIILAAVATLAYAVSSANDAADDTSQKQAQVRYATLRISELIRHCKLICTANDNDLALWRADDNDNGRINPTELVFIESGQDRDYLRLLEFPSAPSWNVPLSNIRDGTAKQVLISTYSQNQTVLVPECSNVQFYPTDVTPQSSSVSISFDLTENGIDHQYQINAALRGWAGNLLNDSGTALVSDDD